MARGGLRWEGGEGCTLARKTSSPCGSAAPSALMTGECTEREATSNSIAASMHRLPCAPGHEACAPLLWAAAQHSHVGCSDPTGLG